MQIKGVKYFGGGKYAERGVLFGIIFGLFFSPIGIIIGPLLGSFIGAKLEKNDFVSSIKISIGALIGFFFEVLFAKLVYVFFTIYQSILIFKSFFFFSFSSPAVFAFVLIFFEN